ncbi:J domain-containing protein [Candidatus Poribacteria bacterium]|nr:J domain-containing protein [Candidatus Poribacteria bacterium]MYF55777.1 J domain-containing protein [Candidatus Poribacteria bacterium]
MRCFVYMNIPNYYQILEVGRDATASEIKHAFRKLAKRYHPDKLDTGSEPDQIADANRMFREVCSAYDVLQDKKRKSDYDRRLQYIERQTASKHSFYDRFRNVSQDYAKLELLFQSLLHQNYETGIFMYEQLCSKCEKKGREWCIDDFFNYEDSRDCEFLIAEAYQKLGFANGNSSVTERYRKIERAMQIYESLLSAEGQRPCFKHFIREVKDRLKRIYLYHFSIEGYQESSRIPLSKISALELPKRETAWMYKKIAEFYVEIKSYSEAREVLLMAFELQPKLVGAKKICRILNIGNQQVS